MSAPASFARVSCVVEESPRYGARLVRTWYDASGNVLAWTIVATLRAAVSS